MKQRSRVLWRLGLALAMMALFACAPAPAPDDGGQSQEPPPDAGIVVDDSGDTYRFDASETESQYYVIVGPRADGDDPEGEGLTRLDNKVTYSSLTFNKEEIGSFDVMRTEYRLAAGIITRCACPIPPFPPPPPPPFRAFILDAKGQAGP